MYSKIKFLTLVSAMVFSSIYAFNYSYTFFNPPKFLFDETDNPMVRSHIEYISDKQYNEEGAVLEVFSGEDRITMDTNIVYEYFFESDGNIKTTEQKAPDHLVNLTKIQLDEKIEGFQIVSFSPEEVILRKTINTAKSGGYILGIWDNRIAVFSGEANGTALVEVMDTPVSALSDEEISRLMEGIIIESELELMRVLEDYSS